MLTKTAESRDIMTKLFFRDENVRVQAEAAIARWNAAQAGTPAAASAGADVPEGEVSDDNPF
jgi:hypothetical protein